METAPLVSVIVPVYNAAERLPACLDSVRGQTFGDFECILVDDGSPDDSGALCAPGAGIRGAGAGRGP